MSGGEATEQAPEEAAEEPGGMSERTARAVLVVVACGAMWGIVAAVPETAYFVAGIIACKGCQKARSWIGQRGREDEPEADEVTAEDLVETLHELAAPNVFLADLAAAFGLSPADARTLLEAHQIRIRRAVRNGQDTGVGVHRDDVPPLPHPLSDTPERGVDLHNQQPTVEPIGMAGVVIKDGSETARHHRVK